MQSVTLKTLKHDSMKFNSAMHKPDSHNNNKIAITPKKILLKNPKLICVFELPWCSANRGGGLKTREKERWCVIMIMITR